MDDRKEYQGTYSGSFGLIECQYGREEDSEWLDYLRFKGFCTGTGGKPIEGMVQCSDLQWHPGTVLCKRHEQGYQRQEPTKFNEYGEEVYNLEEETNEPL